MEDAIRDLVRAIKGDAVANEALDRLADSADDGSIGGDYRREAMHERIAIERAAA